MIENFVKVLLPFVLAFFIGIGITPFITAYLYKYKCWKKTAGKVDAEGNETVEFNKLHGDKETSTPRMGGIVIWLSSCITIVIIWAIAHLSVNPIFLKLEFLSRSQTWLPFGALLIGAGVGLIDDWFEIKGRGNHIAGGLSLRQRLGVVTLMGLFAGSWFFFKLDVSTVSFIVGEIPLGYLFIPFFALVMVIIYASGVIDGIDGLAGGIFAIIFISYSIIAFQQDQINLAAFCSMVSGSILAFLWFNIPPARFYMSETGSMALTTSLAVVAFMTDSLGGGEGVLLLPIIALALMATVASNIIQVVSKKVYKKKIFKIAPLHHHFEAIGWPSYKVTMRYWVLSVIFAILGIILSVILV